MRPLLALAAAALAVLAFTACGRAPTSKDYTAEVTSIVAGVSIAPGAMNTGDPVADTAALERLGEGYGDLAERLGELDAPPEIAGLHRQMVGGLAAQGEALRDGAEAVRRDDRASYEAELARLRVASAQWSHAAETLVARGYGTVPAGV